MPTNFAVQAQVVDLRADTPKQTDVFLVDTNVWFWACYGKAGLSLPSHLRQKLTDYPGYLSRCARNGLALHWCGLSFPELAHQIEKTEHDIFCRTTPAPVPKPKEFRHNFSVERQRVVQEIQTAWHAVESMGRPLPHDLVIDSGTVTTALRHLSQMALDGYDLFAVQAINASGVTQVISDDGDFCLVPNIVLFTANRNVLQAAQAQGKLLVR
ncbi:MAG: hypothetical protein WC003_03680 [Terrimicrobiaceae bacterium]